MRELVDCGDCGVKPGQMHEAVAKTGGRLVWSGVWPGVPECVELGWYAKRNLDGPGWVSCRSDEPGAQPDLNRLAREAQWNRETRRFVLKQ